MEILVGHAIPTPNHGIRSVRQVISCCFVPRHFSLCVGGLMSSSNRVHIYSRLSGKSEVFLACMQCFG